MNGHCVFISFLASTTQHSSIKVYLSGVRALHIEQGVPNPLANCLCHQPVVHGTKCCHGSPSTNRPPITNDLMLVVWHSLDLHLLDHCIFRAACSLGYFGFLRASEFRTTTYNLPSLMSSLHLGVQDIAVDSPSAPSCMCITIKGSRTYPFRKGCFIHTGVKQHPLCVVHALMSYLALRGDRPGPPFVFQNGQPLLA